MGAKKRRLRERSLRHMKPFQATGPYEGGKRPPYPPLVERRGRLRVHHAEIQRVEDHHRLAVLEAERAGVRVQADHEVLGAVVVRVSQREVHNRALDAAGLPLEAEAHAVDTSSEMDRPDASTLTLSAAMSCALTRA